jgi:hypothetical protein
MCTADGDVTLVDLLRISEVLQAERRRTVTGESGRKLQSDVRALIMQARLVVAARDLTPLHSSLCNAESLCMHERPGKALALLHAVLLRYTNAA